MLCRFLYLVSLNSLLQQLYRILQEIFSDLLNPVLMTSIVFVALFAILSVLDCFLGEDGWYLVDLKQSQDAKHYFGEERFVKRITNNYVCIISDKLRTASPVHNIHIECFHTETKSAINTFKGNILTK